MVILVLKRVQMGFRRRPTWPTAWSDLVSECTVLRRELRQESIVDRLILQRWRSKKEMKGSPRFPLQQIRSPFKGNRYPVGWHIPMKKRTISFVKIWIDLLYSPAPLKGPDPGIVRLSKTKLWNLLIKRGIRYSLSQRACILMKCILVEWAVQCLRMCSMQCIKQFPDLKM